MQVDERRLSDFLFDSGALSRRDIDRARALASERGEQLEDTLIHAGLLREDEVRRAIAAVLGVPFVLLQKSELPIETLILLPESFSRARSAVAFGESANGIEVALLSLDDLDAVRLQVGQGRKVLPRLTSAESITYALLQYQKHLKNTFGAMLSKEIMQMQAAESAADNPSRADAAVRAADALLRHALHQQASEVHLEPSSGSLRVRYRAGEGLHDAMTLPLFSLPLLASRFKSLARLPLASGVPAAGRFKISPDSGHQVSISVSTTPVVYEDKAMEKISLALAHESLGREGLSLSSLGFSETNKRHLRRVLAKQEGLVLICGSAGAGKTTLLYTLLDELAAPSLRIASIEERVSMSLPGVSQSEINIELGMNAAACLRAELRHDPDVIALDCAIDEELAVVAAEAANRGIFVFVCVEAPTAAEGIEYILNLGVPGTLLAATMVASVGVRAVPKICADSKAVYRLSRAEQNVLEARADIKRVLEELKAEQIVGIRTPWKDVLLYAALPCGRCEEGYAGVLGLQEILPISLALKDALREASGAEVLHAQAKDEGMKSLVEDALFKAAQGLTSVVGLFEVAGE